MSHKPALIASSDYTKQDMLVLWRTPRKKKMFTALGPAALPDPCNSASKSSCLNTFIRGRTKRKMKRVVLLCIVYTDTPDMHTDRLTTRLMPPHIEFRQCQCLTWRITSTCKRYVNTCALPTLTDYTSFRRLGEANDTRRYLLTHFVWVSNSPQQTNRTVQIIIN
jgi:hypothetical protein